MMNILSKIPAKLSHELTEIIAHTKNIRIERIVSHGHNSPLEQWYDQIVNEFVLLLKGKARLQFENELIEMKAGDWIDIPAHRKHRVEWTTPEEQTIWLAVFYS